MKFRRPISSHLRATIACFGILPLVAALVVYGQAGSQKPASPDWTAQWHWETGAPPGTSYVGSQTCAGCHGSIASAQKTTAMARAASEPASSAVLLDHAPLSYQDGPYRLRLEYKEHNLLYSATDGRGALSVPIRWAFGLGNAGLTFIFEQDGTYYESRVSYYSNLKALDLTIGHSRDTPPSLSAALGRPLPAAEVKKCFSCHTSEDISGGVLRIADLHPGVTCENCHGPGSEHVHALASPPDNRSPSPRIFNPGTLAPADLNDFCGSCHRSTRDVLLMNIRDIRNIRFQPYRIENSRCYDPTDKRITCVACHDPHRDLATSSASYDAKCLQCHAQQGKGRSAAAACPKATHDCVSCHMPKIALPGAHYEFTDHYIRVVRPGERYPG